MIVDLAGLIPNSASELVRSFAHSLQRDEKRPHTASGEMIARLAARRLVEPPEMGAFATGPVRGGGRSHPIGSPRASK
jgi:hypothetical protein